MVVRKPVFFGLCLGLVAGVVTLVFWMREEGDPLTGATLKNAATRWENASVPSYVVEIETRGLRPAHHRVVVENGKVTRRTTDGQEVAPRLLGTWSVAGMFETLRMELRNKDKPKIPYGVDTADQVVTRVVFDPTYGYPKSYLRHVLGHTGSIEWVVLRFAPGPR